MRRALPDDRGQAFTLEALFASLLLLSAVVFALQTTAITPLSASTSSQQIQNQQGAVAEGFLATAAERDQLKPAVLYWDTANEWWHNSGSARTYPMGPPNDFGNQLNDSFREWGVASNVYVHYYVDPDDGDRSRRRQTMVDMGSPSTNAVQAQRTLTLYDDDVLRDENGDKTGQTLSAHEDEFYAPDAAEDSGVYNVVTIEVVVWRI